MRIVYALLLSAAALNATAALPPQSSAPLSAHLLEVNAQWRVQDAAFLGDALPAAFSDEADRISTHLRMVRERLLSRDASGLSAEQRARRTRLLERLGDYAHGRTFPQNSVLAYRNPVFIDPNGTACAVGWLMIESGHADLARSISAGFNTGYLHEIADDARYAEQVDAWTDAHGFTADELAWIQPGYPPNFPWLPLGGGANGSVRVLEKLSDGRLLVAGAFTDAGGIAANRVAVWDGNVYEALGDGVQGDVTCAVEHAGSIYLGGAMLSGPTDLARWNGSAWEFSSVFDGKYPYISALHVHNGVLHAAGIVTGFAGGDHFVQRLNGSQWEAVGSMFNGPVLDLATHDGELVAGGEFTELAIPTEPIVRHVAALQGSDWINLAAGLDATVRVLESVNGELLAGGDLINNVVPRFGLARLGASATTWEMLMPNLANYIFPTTGDPYIDCIAEDNGSIYFGGSFFISTTMMTIGTNIARWNGTDQVLELAGTDGVVSAVCVHDGALVMGGEFSFWLPHIAALDLTTGIDDAPAPTLAIVPNPVVDAVRITNGDPGGVASRITLRDAAGRPVHAPQTRQSGTVTIDASGLAAGTYLVVMDGRSAGRFVKL